MFQYIFFCFYKNYTIGSSRCARVRSRWRTMDRLPTYTSPSTPVDSNQDRSYRFYKVRPMIGTNANLVEWSSVDDLRGILPIVFLIYLVVLSQENLSCILWYFFIRQYILGLSTNHIIWFFGKFISFGMHIL